MKCPNCGKEMRASKKDYRYGESGLKNVVLKDVTIHECDCGEMLPEIPYIKRLHQRIAMDLINKQSPLTGQEFRFLRKNMDVSAKELCELLGVTTVTLSRWENNEKKIGPQSDRLLRYLYLTRSGLVSPKTAKRLENIMRGIVDKRPTAEPILISRSSLTKKQAISELRA